MVSWLRDFYDYYLDAWIITDQGIVDVEWHGWFHRASTRVLYTDVQGVSYEINGVIGTVMRYGTISIEKISTGDAVELCDVSNPRAVEQIVLKAMEQYLHGKNLADSKHVQEILSQLVSQQVQLEEFEEEDDDDDDDNDESEDEEEEDDDDEK